MRRAGGARSEDRCISPAMHLAAITQFISDISYAKRLVIPNPRKNPTHPVDLRLIAPENSTI
jgi:hypothetical protein